MNKHSSIKSTGSLLERASELYDFGSALRGGSTNAPAQPVEDPPVAIAPETAAPVNAQPAAQRPMAARPLAPIS